MALTEQDKLYQLAKIKAAHYCSYQERTIAEVKKKLLDWGIQDKVAITKLLQELQEANFLDEKRYIEAFVRGRFTIKKWGKRKIYYELVKKQIDPSAIQEGLDTIEETAYLDTIEQLIVQKKKSIATLQPALARKKITHYLLQKGYELELIQAAIQSTLKISLP
jgi:regulatory protein